MKRLVLRFIQGFCVLLFLASVKASNYCTPCPAKYYCDYEGSTRARSCKSGLSCSLGNTYQMVERNMCQKGHWCNGRYVVQCSQGTYIDYIGGRYPCKKCPAGQYCMGTGLHAPTGQCNDGYICEAGSNNPTNSISPPGKYAIQGIAYKCWSGTYQSNAGFNFCFVCPEGYYCGYSSLQSTTAACSPGWYCGFRERDSQPTGQHCLSGHMCPQGLLIPCSKGYYQPSTGEISCLPCPVGKYCETTGLSAPTGDCTVGYCCNTASITQVTCATDESGADESGAECDFELTRPHTTDCSKFLQCDNGLTHVHVCDTGLLFNPYEFVCDWPYNFNCLPVNDCIAGSYLEDGVCVLCPQGSYCDTNGLSAPTGPCDDGWYCQQGETTPTPEAQICLPGHMCPQGIMTACVIGTYQPAYGQTECVVCDGGYYCGVEGSSTVEGMCGTGFYCPNGTTTETPQNNICQKGYECPRGSVAPIPCKIRFYMPEIQQGNCLTCPHGQSCDNVGMIEPEDCPVGYECTQGIKTICPLGFYCNNGIAYRCPSGTFASSTGSVECTTCTAGYYCLHTTSYGEQGVCPEGFFCPIGTTNPYANPCLPGNKCPLGSEEMSACDPGTYQPYRIYSYCLPCLVGHYCPLVGRILPEPCAQGTYQSLPSQIICLPCPLAGYKCPEGSILQEPCAPGTFQPLPSQGICLSCTEGMFCNDTALIEPVYNCIEAGYKCPEGSIIPEPCAPGTFQSLPGQGFCQSCTEGMFCNDTGLIEPVNCIVGMYCSGTGVIEPSNCPAGHMCPLGSILPDPCDPGTFQPLPSQGICLTCTEGMFCSGTGVIEPLNCPAGNKCPEGRILQVPCDSGTFQPLPSQGICLPCTEGMFCNGTGVIEPLNCPAGNKCPEGSILPEPCAPGTFQPLPSQGICLACTEGMYCTVTGVIDPLNCPAGNKCPEGSILPEPCAPGTFQPLPNQGICLPCTEGMYCNDTSSIEPVHCTVGHKCPEGSIIPDPCDQGTFQSLPSQGICLSCTEGMYCNGTSVIEPVVCTVGMYCNGTGVIEPSNCPAGHMCPLGSILPDPCDPGTFQPLPSQGICLSCTEGMYCNATGVIEPINCPAGNKCPEGSILPEPCAPGTFQPLPSQGICLPCTEGMYCNVTGVIEPLNCPAGNKCPKGSTLPEPCDLGTFQPLASQGICLACTEGMYCNDTSSIEPVNCTVGHKCPEGSIIPDPCDQGTFQSLPSQGICLSCTEGMYCNGTGVVEPVVCTLGMYCNGTGVIEPSNCPAGHMCPLGSILPDPCNPGTFQTLPSQGVCLSCKEGVYCNGTGVIEPLNCPAGNKCPEGSILPEPCAPGKFQPLPSQGICLACTYGMYCNGTGVIEPLNCPAGNKCPEGSILPDPCDIGTFQPLLSQGICLPCTEGMYCNGTSSIEPVNCTVGHKCPEGSILPEPCTEGTFQPLPSQGICLPCTEGMYCNDTSLIEPVICTVGMYCNGTGVIEPSNCPAGHMCPLGSILPDPCDPGTFQPLPSQGICLPCTEGMYCNGTGVIEPLNCPAGNKCPDGRILPVPCAPGTFQPLPSQGICLACTEGIYCNATGVIEPLNCPAGNKCPEGSILPEPCTLGTFQPLPSQGICLSCTEGMYCNGTGVIEPVNCTAGYKCPEGSILPDPCDQGTYQPLARQGICLSCTEGMYCNDTSLIEPVNCTVGMYCNGTGVIEPSNCPAGHKCPQGSILPDPCDLGTFQPLPSQGICLSCTEGMYCNDTSIIEPVNCTVGMYCNGTGVIEPSNCPAGHMCPLGSILPDPCDLGTFQPLPSQGICLSCTEGMYCNGTSGIEPVNCTVGHKCPEGSILPDPCDPGTFQPLTSQGICLPCTEGMFCNGTSLIEPVNCTVGMYCNGTGVIEPSNCPAGHKCPRGSILPEPCDPGTFQPLPSQGICLSCTEGMYCNGTGVIEPVVCTVGHKCPEGSIITEPCDPGTFQSLPSQVICLPCTEGMYCNDTSLIEPVNCTVGMYCNGTGVTEPSNCPAGHMCPLGSLLPEPCTLGTFQPLPSQGICLSCTEGMYCNGTGVIESVNCTAGHKCPEGSILPETCGPGTFQPLQSQVICLPCTEGMYCNGTGLIEPVNCTVGMYCNGTGVIEPSNCPAGHKCPQGSIIPEPCTPGTFQPLPSQGICLACTEGMYCNATGVIRPLNCPSGHKCLKGSITPDPCDLGTFQPLPSQGICLSCTAGMYCNDTSLIEPVNCTVGMYCNGTGVIEPSNCPAGHKCPQGSSLAIPCASGYYQALIGQSDCQLCPIGHYCDQSEALIEQQSGIGMVTHGVVTPKLCPFLIYCDIGSPVATCTQDTYVPGPVQISIDCEPSCDKLMSSITPVQFSVTCRECGWHVISYIWSIRQCLDFDHSQCRHCADHVEYTANPTSTFTYNVHSSFFNTTDWNYFSVFVKVLLDSGKEGMAYHVWQYFVPTAPLVCNIVPESGFALTTHFTILCDETPVDDNMTLTYSLYSTNAVGVMWLYEDATPNTTDCVLPPGDSGQNFLLDLTMVAKMRDHIYFKTTFNTTVTMPDTNVFVIDLVEHFLSVGSDSEYSIDYLLKTGHTERAVQTLNSIIDIVTVSPNQEKYEAVYTTVVDRLSKVNVSSVSQVYTVSTVLNKITKTKGTLSQDAQDLAMNTYNELADTFTTMEQDNMKADLKMNAKNLLTGLGSMIDIETDILVNVQNTSQQEPTDKTSTSDTAQGSTVENKVKVEKAKTQSLLKSVNKITNFLLDRQEVGGEPVVVVTDKMSVAVKKVTAENLGGEELVPEGAGNSSKTSFKFPKSLKIGNESDTFGIQMVYIKKNPFVWSDNSAAITSPVLDVSVKDSRGNTVEMGQLMDDIEFSNHMQGNLLSRNLRLLLNKNEESITLAPNQQFKGFIRFNLTMTADKITTLHLLPPSNMTNIKLYIRPNREPVMEEILNTGYQYPGELNRIKLTYSDFFVPKDTHSDIFNKSSFVYINFCQNGTNMTILSNCTKMIDYLFQTENLFNNNSSECLDMSSISNCSDVLDYLNLTVNVNGNLLTDSSESDPTSDLADGTIIQTFNIRRGFLFFVPNMSLLNEKVTSYLLHFGMAVDLDDYDILQDLKDLDPTCLGANESSCETMIDLDLKVAATSLACRFWNVTEQTWSNEGCKVSEETSMDQLVCSCNHMTAFAASVLVLPTFIDPFEDYKLFLTFFDNPVVVTAVVIVWMIYFFLIHWARRSDKHDLQRVGVIHCSDNDPSHQYMYLVSVMTGWWKAAGTSANVYIYLKGSKGVSSKKRLTSSVRPCFQSGYEDWFLVTTEDSLGCLETVKLWHDNTGTSPHWYVNVVFIKDLQQQESWTFIFNDWLAVDRGHLRHTSVTLQAFTQEELKYRQKFHFMVKSVKELREGHLWISIFSKPPNSTFTRVQRLTCALSLLLTAMLTNIMFYGTTPYPEDQITAGAFTLSLSQLIIGIESSLIMLPINILFVQLFNKIKPRPRGPTTMSENMAARRRISAKLRGNKEKQRILKSNLQIMGPDVPDILKECYCDFDIRAISAKALRTNVRDPELLNLINHVIEENERVHNQAQFSYWDDIPSMIGYSTDNMFYEANETLDSDNFRLSRQSSIYFMADQTNNNNNLGQNNQSNHSYSSPSILSTRSGSAFSVATPVKKPDGKFLPWWFLYVTWTLVICTCLICSYFVTLYGLKYGYTRSVEWLVSFLTGFIQNVCVQQPLKVVVIAVLLTLIFKRTVDFDDFGPDIEPDEDEEYLHKVVTQPKSHLPYVPPISKSMLEVIKYRLRLEWLMKLTLRDLILHLMYLAVVLVVVTGHRNTTTAYRNMLTIKHMLVDSQDGVALSEVRTMDDIYAYMKETLHPIMEVINGSHTEAQLGSNHYLLGSYRLRQLRARNGLCESVLHEKLPHTCKTSYWINDDETRNYKGTWARPLADTDPQVATSGPWSHKTSWQLKTSPYSGTHATYSGGGYVADGHTHKDLIENIQNVGWLDEWTRAVFVELTIYNPNVDLFSTVVLLFETTNLGAVFPSHHIETTSLYHYSNDFESFILGCEIMFVIFNIVYIYVQIKQYQTIGKKEYFKSFWNYVDIVQSCLAISCMGLFIQRALSVQSIMAEYRQMDRHQFLNFYPAFLWDGILQYVMAFLVALVIFRTTKLLQFNHKTLLISHTLLTARRQIFGFLIIFTILLWAYGHCMFLMFCSTLNAYRTIGHALISNVHVLLGEAEFSEINATFRVIGPIYVVVFVCTVSYGLMILFIAIVNIGRLEAKHKLNLRGNKFELLEYMSTKLNMLLDR